MIFGAVTRFLSGCGKSYRERRAGILTAIKRRGQECPRSNVHAPLSHHQQGVDGEGALTGWQYHHWIQIELGDLIPVIVGKPRELGGHVGQSVEVCRRCAAHAGENFGAFQTFQRALGFGGADGRRF